MSVVKSIKKARQGGVSDEEILKEIKKQNPDKGGFFKEMEALNLDASQILEEVIKRGEKRGENFNFKNLSFILFSLLSFFIITFSLFYFDVLSHSGLFITSSGSSSNDINVKNDDYLSIVPKNNEGSVAVDVVTKEDKHFFTGNIEKERGEKIEEIEIKNTLPDDWDGKFQLPILMYHHIKDLSEDASSQWRDLTVSPDIFKKQMAYLSENDYNTITFADLKRFLENRVEIPEKSLIITFDDGWLNQYENAYPVLKDKNLRATFFLVGRYIGGRSFISKDQIKEMIKEGMEVGSHSMTHANLTALNSENLKKEVAGSKNLFKNMFDVDILVFAYPYGSVNSSVVSAVDLAGYYFARTTNSGVDQNINRLYNLKTVHVTNDLSNFKKILSP